MKIEISYPGQAIQTVEALPNIVRHFENKDYDLPFIKVVEKPATLWSRMTKDRDGNERYEFNHLEVGHCANDTPTPKHASHKQVWNGKWKKEFVTLSDTNRVIRK